METVADDGVPPFTLCCARCGREQSGIELTMPSGADVLVSLECSSEEKSEVGMLVRRWDGEDSGSESDVSDSEEEEEDGGALGPREDWGDGFNLVGLRVTGVW